ncbi:HD domain-containing protein [Candidatus Woesearchaeota archaeon]|nr:HD domain-containing protein [Candidatus Woesearchaeota archaeon]
MISPITKFLLEVGKLKKVKRTGWLLKGISSPESVAEHSFRVAVMAMTLSEGRDLDRFYLLKMALIHDIAESITTDLVWEHGKISDLEKLKSKHQKELKSAKEIISGLSSEEDYFVIIDDYINRRSQEAKFLKEIDKLEMAIQTLEYEEVAGGSLDEFWENVEKYLKDEQLVGILGELKSIRKKTT